MLNSISKRLFWIVLLAVFTGLATSALAADMVNAGSYGPPAGGVYTSPYLIKIDGVPTWVICDDYEATLKASWTANVTSLSSILNGSAANQTVEFDRDDFAKQKSDYSKVAFLATALIQPGIKDSQSEALSYAIWSVFDTVLRDNLITKQNGFTGHGYLTAEVSGLVISYYNQTYSGPPPEMLIYTPTDTGAGRSQEFLRVNVAEASTLAVLAVDLLGLAGLVLFARRRLARAR